MSSETKCFFFLEIFDILFVFTLQWQISPFKITFVGALFWYWLAVTFFVTFYHLAQEPKMFTPSFCNRGESCKVSESIELYILSLQTILWVAFIIFSINNSEVNALICWFSKKLKKNKLCPHVQCLLGGFGFMYGGASFCVDFLNDLGCQVPSTTRLRRGN